ncbi:glycosyltransferase family 2 protein [Francisella philomiragia]|uniref:glycosyltransferase family 2 protein n=1 Tax=Francisella philomiragia TaxID=28110 RepID=UPI0019030A32|nr:glycosyltransferase family 2 protein [Francisella philomiragia]MBK2267748.1 glycosyltransferase family 2 protein [Francisella philomiragia]MBK2279154.1 glycosyltransferase family 2 protein [Francisella philomiragia]MBK2287057.1 glycosyltransferase family 2 protein [Francisella philomiragia]MBK2288986.1 glycosyltransferase family 2 protein [Francisella philomiragia]MBK2290704.1 glycosyltransferase family 2 protein [Francisella philomiragia]
MLKNDITDSEVNHTQPLVSICCATYNQEAYIAKAIDSFLMQQTNFPFEIIINDDCSTDNTAKIVSEYQAKYPNIIKSIFQSENQFCKGLSPFNDILFPASKGKYIALCEGDDYWTDPHKLQKQVDFLEANPEFMGCAHATRFLRDGQIAELASNADPDKSIYLFEEYVGLHYFHTSSWVYRYDKYKEKVNEYLKLNNGDNYLSYVFLTFGPIKYLDQEMSVYRVNDKGVWSSQKHEDNNIENILSLIKNIEIFDKYEQHLSDVMLYNLMVCNHERVSNAIVSNCSNKNIEKILKMIIDSYSSQQSNLDNAYKNNEELQVSIVKLQESIMESITESNRYIKILEDRVEYERSKSFLQYLKSRIYRFYLKIKGV